MCYTERKKSKWGIDMSKIELLNELIRKIEQLQCKNNDERREIVSIAELYARKFFGKDNDYPRLFTDQP